jgi:integrase
MTHTDSIHVAGPPQTAPPRTGKRWPSRCPRCESRSPNRLLIVLTERVKHALRALPRGLGRASVFANPVTGAAWVDIRKSFHRALEAAKLEGLWFHDLRRSFVTPARKHGVPESVVMRMSGHRTRAVFDRYNVVDDEDLRAAVRALENPGHF